MSKAQVRVIWRRATYPKDDTPGCTAQACGIRDVWGELQRKGAVVLGVSPDSPRKHVKFREKYGLPFTLLSDEAHQVAEKYGTWVEKSMYGKMYMGIERSTFVIDAAIGPVCVCATERTPRPTKSLGSSVTTTTGHGKASRHSCCARLRYGS